MKIAILDIEWYNKASFMPNATCMKLSSYHQQKGDLCFLILDRFDFTLDYDILYAVRTSVGGKLPQELKVRDKRTNLIGPGFKFYDRYMVELPSAIAACRPDYLLYPLKEENRYNNVNMIQFYSNGIRLPVIQDPMRGTKKSTDTLIIDDDFWNHNSEDIQKCLDILNEFHCKNIMFSKPISLKSIVSSEKVQDLFLSLNYRRGSVIEFVNDCGGKYNEEILMFLKKFKDKNPSHAFPPIHFPSITMDHNTHPELAIKDVERCLDIVTRGKKMGVRIYIDSPHRQDTPFWMYFEVLEIWTKYNYNMSLIESMLVSSGWYHKTDVYHIIDNKILWSMETADMLFTLCNRHPDIIKKYGFIQWEDKEFRYPNFNRLYLGEKI